MTRYAKGETSAAVRARQNKIAESLAAKTRALQSISQGGPVPSSLALSKRGRISLGALHEWNDEGLGVHAYSRNSAHQPYHSNLLDHLLQAMKGANDHLEEAKASSGRKPRTKELLIADLKSDVQRLTRTIAELYRAYMHLADTVSESGRADSAYHSALKAHASTLGKARLVLVP